MADKIITIDEDGFALPKPMPESLIQSMDDEVVVIAESAKDQVDKTYQIVTNLSCNLDCTYCYERKYPRRNDVESCVEFIRACFKRDAGTKGGAIIDIIGGEPMMQPKLLIAVFEEVEIQAAKYRRPYIFSISTNGTLFDKPLNKQIIERWGDRISVGVSIDGLPSTHDKHRIFTSTGKGSYEKALEGFNYLKSMNIRELGVKATFTSDTLDTYAASMKNLIDECGAVNIHGNLTYEDIIERGKAPWLANQMWEVVEYWLSKGYDKIPGADLGHILPGGFDFSRQWSPDLRDRLKAVNHDSFNYDRLRPYCGTISHMTCLGFDRQVYGCNRFMSTVTTRQAIAKLENEEIIYLDTGLPEEVAHQWKDFDAQCLSCPMKSMCGSCAAAPYENKDGGREARREYHAKHRQCGWTMAKYMVAQLWHARFGTYDNPQPMCGCGSCSCSTEDSE